MIETKEKIELKYNNNLIITSIDSRVVGATQYHVSTVVPGKAIEFEVILPAVDIANTWNPTKSFDSSLKPDWEAPHEVSLNQSAPIEVFYNYAGNNILTVACNELVNSVQIHAGIHEEDGTVHIQIQVAKPIGDDFQLLLIDQPCPYFEAIQRVGEWWEEMLEPLPYSKEQRQPVYSTWYAFHQEITDEKLFLELPEIKALGINTIILDDGWQTDDNNRGYAYCGDWEVTSNKFKDFQKFVTDMHQQEMKIMVWFSVPFVGVHSKKWEHVKDKLLYYNHDLSAGVLDIRYQENIDFLLNTYTNFVTNYGIDGLKLDFIDEFYSKCETPDYHEGMAFETVQEGLLFLMNELKKRALAINPAFFIEFRQKYIGPKMRNFSNAYRVNDCPYSAVSNRVGIADLRLLSGRTPVHSDMLMWHQNETPENIALQLAACLFGVIQLSVHLQSQSIEQLAVVRHYLKFASNNCELLQEAPLQALDPQLQYPLIRVCNQQKEIIVNYDGKQVICLSGKQVTLVNASAAKTSYLDAGKEVYRVVVSDCLGEIQHVYPEITGLVEIEQTPGSITEIVLKENY